MITLVALPILIPLIATGCWLAVVVGHHRGAAAGGCSRVGITYLDS